MFVVKEYSSNSLVKLTMQLSDELEVVRNKDKWLLKDRNWDNQKLQHDKRKM